MIPTIILGVVIALAVVFFFTMNVPAGKQDQMNYLREMARFFDSEVIPIPDAENSFKISFKYRGREWSYEDIEVPTSKGGEHVGILKLRTSTKLKLTFTERSRTQIRSTVKSLEEVAVSMWGTDAQQVKLPKPLQDFQTHCNNSAIANKLLTDEKVTRVFLNYNNRDSRGHPVMSVHINEGVISLEFHASPELKPSIIELRHNVTQSEKYLQELLTIGETLTKIEAEERQ